MTCRSVRPLAPVLCALGFSLGATAPPACADPGHDPEPTDTESSAVAAPALMPEFAEYELDTVRVRGRIDDLTGTAQSASQGRVGHADLELRPLLREGEILETVPGMVLTQHSGDGKSNQMFLRGFNLDHGTDFATTLEGMPVNLPTHGHGHGYTDLNFLIPELVDHIEFRKGLYYAEIGDFGSAGGAQLHLVRDLPRPFLKAEIGGNAYLRTVLAGSRPMGRGTLLAAAELKNYDGPWDRAQDLDKASGVVRWSARSGRGDDLSFLALGYKNRWASSDQIPFRAVDSGALSPFGQVDSTLGGDTRRLSLAARWAGERGGTALCADVYAVDYELDLFSNFTYLLADPVQGDQFEQVDDRSIFGGTFEATRGVGGLGREHGLRAGLQIRTDAIHDVALHLTDARRRLATVRQDRVTEASGGVFVELSTPWTSRLRTTAGLRADLFRFDVESVSLPENSGTDTDAIVSPKLGAAFTTSDAIELYANVGLGFHSNDARGATISTDPTTGEPAVPVDPLVRSRGAEAGLRIEALQGLRSTVSIWALRLDSELVFVGDGGTTEPSGASTRGGIELANFWRVLPALSLDLDLALSRGRFDDLPDGENRIPGALESVLAGGVTWRATNGLHASARVRHLGAYPLIEDDSVRAGSTTLVNASTGVDLAGVRLDVAILNALDASARDIQYFYASRLPGEDAAGVQDVHFHPVEPRQFRAGVTCPF